MANISSDNGCGEITNYTLKDSANGQIIPSTFLTNNGLVIITVPGLEEDQVYSIYMYMENQYGTQRQGEVPIVFHTNTCM
jgi:hypothetical protein